MDSGIEIYEAAERDIPVLYDLLAAMASRKDPGYFGRCLEEQSAGNRDVIIASKDGAPAGWGMLNWRPQYALYRRLDIPEIQDVNVVPSLRRQGLASAMIAWCESRARGKGCARIGISAGLDAGYGPAQRLYAKLGYMPDGHGVTYDRETVKWGEIRPVDDNLCLMMIKEL